MDHVSEHSNPALPTPIINITGEKIALGPLRRDLISLYERWVNDLEVGRGIGTLAPITTERETEWYEQASKSRTDVTFTIYERSEVDADLRPIGTTGLTEIDHRHQTAEFGILIGEKDTWGKGYGAEAASLMLDYGFTILGLHNIRLQVFSFNQRGIRAYTRVGFRTVGSLREAFRLGGHLYDVILMDCLSTEFQSRVLVKLLDDYDQRPGSGT